MAGAISKYKIDSIATHLVADYRDKINVLYEEIGVEYRQRALALLPTEVLDTYTKFPEYFYTTNYVYIRSTTKHNGYTTINVNVGVPKMANGDTLQVSNEDNLYLGSKVDEILELERCKNVLYRKSICAIEKIKTYKRLQMEFPEAYKILIEKVDRGDVKDDSICDTVESLRAELGVTEKK